MIAARYERLTLASLYYDTGHLDYDPTAHDFARLYPMVLYQYLLHVHSVADLPIKAHRQLAWLHLKICIFLLRKYKPLDFFYATSDQLKETAEQQHNLNY